MTDGDGSPGRQGGASPPAGDYRSRRRQRAAPGNNSCRVPGCKIALETSYSKKHCICETHYSALSVDMGEEGIARFCQQCGRMQPLSAFKGHQRSCRTALDRQSQLRKRRQELAAMQQAESSSGSDGSAGAEAGSRPSAPAAAASEVRRKRQRQRVQSSPELERLGSLPALLGLPLQQQQVLALAMQQAQQQEQPRAPHNQARDSQPWAALLCRLLQGHQAAGATPAAKAAAHVTSESSVSTLTAGHAAPRLMALGPPAAPVTGLHSSMAGALPAAGAELPAAAAETAAGDAALLHAIGRVWALLESLCNELRARVAAQQGPSVGALPAAAQVQSASVTATPMAAPAALPGPLSMVEQLQLLHSQLPAQPTRNDPAAPPLTAWLPAHPPPEAAQPAAPSPLTLLQDLAGLKAGLQQAARSAPAALPPSSNALTSPGSTLLSLLSALAQQANS